MRTTHAGKVLYDSVSRMRMRMYDSTRTERRAVRVPTHRRTRARVASARPTGVLRKNVKSEQTETSQTFAQCFCVFVCVCVRVFRLSRVAEGGHRVAAVLAGSAHRAPLSDTSHLSSWARTRTRYKCSENQSRVHVHVCMCVPCPSAASRRTAHRA